MKLSDLQAVEDLAYRYKTLTDQAKALGPEGIKISIGGIEASEQLAAEMLPHISRGVLRDLTYVEGKLMRLGVTLG